MFREVTAPTAARPRASLPGVVVGRLVARAATRLIRIDYDEDGVPQRITIEPALNRVRHINRLLADINAQLPVNGVLTGTVETSEQRKRRLLGARPGIGRWLRYLADYLVHRVASKLSLTRRMYFALSGGKDRVFSRAEIHGRLVFAGFEVTQSAERDGLVHFQARKRGNPAGDPPPSQGPILRMERVGRNGPIIRGFKIRTMHPYAEHLQPHLYEHNRLEANGKFGSDYRVTTLGRLLRRYWLDELPMVVNVLKADLKLVGVRPLSRHYLSLYPPELVEWRSRHTPGLIPPFYADLPSGFDAILESERRYLARYERQPLRTDLSYLCRIVVNIAFRGARSQ